MIRRLLAGLVVLAVVAVSPAAVRCAEETPEQKQLEKRLEKEEKNTAELAGLTRYDLGIWTLVIFGALVFVLGRFAWGPIMKGLQKREDNIAANHTEAEKARADAEKLLTEVKMQRARASEEMAAIIAEARREADAFREAEKARTAGDIQAERDRLKREIDTARDQALAEIWKQTVEVATLVSSKALGRVVSADDHRRLLDESLAELHQQLSA